MTITKPLFNPKATNQFKCGHADKHVTFVLLPSTSFNRLNSFGPKRHITITPSTDALTILSFPAKVTPTTSEELAYKKINQGVETTAQTAPQSTCNNLIIESKSDKKQIPAGVDLAGLTTHSIVLSIS